MSIVQLSPWNAFDGLPSSLIGWRNPSHWMDREARWHPALDVKESDEGYVISVDVPGVANEDIEVTLDDGVLTIKGSRKLERSSKDNDGRFHSFERVSGQFQRRVKLPVKASGDDVSAIAKDGVLTITVKKPEAIVPKRIEVLS